MTKTLSANRAPCIATAVLLAAVGCAQLPPTSSVAIPPIPAGAARVWVYRDYEPHETLARPYVWLNQQISEPGGAFYRDVASLATRSGSTAPAATSTMSGDDRAQHRQERSMPEL
jgi:hypothetical protein